MHRSRVEAFRHRAAPIIADHPGVSYGCPLLTLTDPILTGLIPAGLGPKWPDGLGQKACRATNVIRHGLCPILTWAREAVKPAAASFWIISLSP
jgi:hypothetical protein